METIPAWNCGLGTISDNLSVWTDEDDVNNIINI